MPDVGFDLNGIVQHVRDFFNEQRRHKKRVIHKETGHLSKEGGADANVVGVIPEIK